MDIFMKNKSAILLAAVMALSLTAFTGCDKGSGIFAQKAPFYSSVSDVTIENIIAHSSPVELAAYKGAFKETIKYNGFGDETVDSGEYSKIYKKTGDKMEANFISKYSDGFNTNVYISNDKDDMYIYNMTNMGINRSEATEERTGRGRRMAAL